MSDEYLWDRTGKPDPEVERLERVLARYRSSPETKRTASRRMAFAALAACLILGAAFSFWRIRMPLSQWRMAGAQLTVGQSIETGGNGTATLEAESFGEVTLDGNSRLRILPSSAGNERLGLTRGTMHALIWAPPARFLVDTPSAKAIDLGCSYTLSVLPDDSGFLTVQTGWVAFQSGSIESFIPAGAACRTRPRSGPGLPFFESASKELREGVAKFDQTAGREGLAAIAASAGPRDALTLWHLVTRTSGADRELVVERLAALVPGIDSVGLNAGNSHALDQAWALLGLGGADWWRKWKHSWQP